LRPIPIEEAQDRKAGDTGGDQDGATAYSVRFEPAGFHGLPSKNSALRRVAASLLMVFALYSLLYTGANIFLEDEKKFILHCTRMSLPRSDRRKFGITENIPAIMS
jgi:hypothetical protein